MKITILSMFPKTLCGLYENPLVQRAMKNGKLELKVLDIKDFTNGSFRDIDDSPYGGGKGMILRVDALCNALNSVKTDKSHVVLFSPKGQILKQKKVKELSEKENLILVCGHYEGVDSRFEDFADEQISIGDYILSGGENAAAVLCDSLVRLLPGILKQGCTSEESFENNLLEYRQFTHPLEFNGKTVPEVLLSGNDREIALYKEASSIMETARFRPDLLLSSAGEDSIGRSESRIMKFKNFVLKINPSENEYEVYKWMERKVNVPKIIDCFEGTDRFILMSRIKGRMLCNDYYFQRPSLLVKRACEALKSLWSVDITDCPFDCSPQAKLNLAKRNIENKRVDFNPEYGFKTPEDLYSWLCDNIPSSYERTFTHGDFCLPNVFVSSKGKITYIDVGLAGVGDKYCDIALCLRSLRYNSKISSFSFNENEFFDQLEIEPDWQKIKWYTLLDELF